MWRKWIVGFIVETKMGKGSGKTTRKFSLKYSRALNDLKLPVKDQQIGNFFPKNTTQYLSGFLNKYILICNSSSVSLCYS